jgi:hypothetical protein
MRIAPHLWLFIAAVCSRCPERPVAIEASAAITPTAEHPASRFQRRSPCALTPRFRFARRADGGPASNSVQLVATPVTVRGSPDCRRPSGKAARYIERLALPRDVITSARQLVCQRLGCNDLVRLCLLALVVSLGFKAPNGRGKSGNGFPSRTELDTAAIDLRKAE